MTPAPVTTNLLHDLVVGSHAQGVTSLAVASVIDHHGRILLVIQGGYLNTDTSNRGISST
jgi:hypothetical protein